MYKLIFRTDWAKTVVLPTSIQKLLSSWTTCAWSIKVIGQELQSVSHPQWTFLNQYHACISQSNHSPNYTQMNVLLCPLQCWCEGILNEDSCFYLEISLIKLRWGIKDHILCTWVQCATFVDGLAMMAILVFRLARKTTSSTKFVRSCLLPRFVRSRKFLSQSEAGMTFLVF